MQENTDERKKILYVITKGNFGGAQRYVYDLATNLPKDKFEIVVACGEGDLLVERLKNLNIETIKLENLGREIDLKNDFRTIKALIKIIKEERPNVVHLNSSKVGLLGSLAVLYFRIKFSIFNLQFSVPKVVFTAHGWAFNEPNRSFISKIIYYIGHHLTILLCDTTIAVSEKAKKDVNYFPFVGQKIKVIYNGIDKFKTLEAREARGIFVDGETNKMVIFSTSELHPNKGIDLAIKGLALLPKEAREKIIYCVAGAGEEKENLEKLVSELNLKETVKFLGFVPEAKNLLAGADIFLLPSRTEALPYAILEAGFVGLPTIATSVGGIPEVIRDMQNGILIHPKNPKEIAEAILYYLDHPEKQKEFGKEIKKTIVNFFSLDRMVEETIRLYQ